MYCADNTFNKYAILFPIGVKRGRYSLHTRTVHILESRSSDTAESNEEATDTKAKERSERFDKLITKLCKIADENKLFSPDLLAAVPYLQKERLVCVKPFVIQYLMQH